MLHRVSFSLQQESEKVNNNKIIKKKENEKEAIFAWVMSRWNSICTNGFSDNMNY